MTRRMVNAVANPHTDVLGHCTGRLVDRRAGDPRGVARSTPSSCSRPASGSASRSRSTPGRSGSTRPRRLLEPGGRDRLPVLDRHRRARARPAGLAALRLRAGRGVRCPGRAGGQHPAGGRAARLGRPPRLTEQDAVERLLRQQLLCPGGWTHGTADTVGRRTPGERPVRDRHRLAGLQALVLVRPPLRRRQHPLRAAAGQQRRRGRAGQRLRDPPAPGHGDRHLGAARPAGAPGLPGAQRADLPRAGPADERRHRHPALREERQLAADRRRRAPGPGALRADVGAAGRERHPARLRAARDRRRAAARRAGPGRQRPARAQGRRRHLDRASGTRPCTPPGWRRRAPSASRTRRSCTCSSPTASVELEGTGPLGTGDAARITGGAGQLVTAGPDGAEVLVWEMHAGLAA